MPPIILPYPANVTPMPSLSTGNGDPMGQSLFPPTVVSMTPNGISMQQQNAAYLSNDRLGLSSQAPSQEGHENKQSPLGQAAKNGAKAAFNLPNLGFDALMGAVWMTLWRGVDELRVRNLNKKFPGESFKAGWSFSFIPIIVAFGMILRAATNGYRAYKQEKAPQTGISFQI